MLLLADASAGAQTSPQAPSRPLSWLAPTPMTPNEAHERLAFLVGTWTLAGHVAADDFRDTCDWLGEGRRHVVCRATWTMASSPREALGVFSYRATDAVYIYRAFRASGVVQMFEGTVSDDGKILEFHGEEGSGSAFTRTRVVIHVNADGSVQFTEQTATGDPEAVAQWSPETIVTYVRATR